MLLKFKVVRNGPLGAATLFVLLLMESEVWAPKHYMAHSGYMRIPDEGSMLQAHGWGCRSKGAPSCNPGWASSDVLSGGWAVFSTLVITGATSRSRVVYEYFLKSEGGARFKGVREDPAPFPPGCTGRDRDAPRTDVALAASALHLPLPPGPQGDVSTKRIG